jgi:hypothetical protein
MCPNPEEKLAQDCLANPWGPNDGPRRECLSLMEPKRIDDDVWLARMCQKIQCPPNEIRATTKDGACDCIAPPRVIGSPTAGCPIGQYAMCPFEEPNACLCLPPDLGSTPFGNNPVCRLDMAAYPGSLEEWTVPSRDMLAVHRIGNDNFVMFETGRQPAISAVMPTFFRDAFTAVGTVIRPRAVISRARPASTNLDLQLYCHNPAQNLHHVAMGQCRLNGLTPGVPGSCDITLNASIRDRCMTGAFSFEWTVQAPTSYVGSVGVGRFDFAGTMTATPSNRLFPLCPRPTTTPAPSPTNPTPDDPFITRLAPRPLWEAAGGTPINPDVLLPLGGGGSVRVTPAVSLLDYIRAFAP